MNPTEIEFAVKDLVAKPYDPDTFPFDLIGIYNTPKITVSKLKTGQTNAAKKPGDVLWKKHLFFRPANPGDDVAAIADALAADPLTAKHKPRFIFVTNGEQVHVRDIGQDDTCNTEFARLDESSDFLLPLAGFERRAAIVEHPADVKAAKRLLKLYQAILAANPTWSDGNHTHELNLFMTRILFCFYAEDTGIFEIPQIFTNTVVQHTNEDGSNLASLLDCLFRIMNIEEGKRPSNTSAVHARFPYVNGSLFEATLDIPEFTRTARRLFIECGELDWKTINPDVFGSMIQTIAEPGARGELGMHYTSVPNIMKVLQPLFLDDINDAYDKAKDSVAKLEALLARLANIRVFDPACGSGNFLIIAYKELRQIEMRILSRISEISPKNPLRLSAISLQNFFGIDLVDFACETAKLSLWIAEYQMNSAFKELFGASRPALPLGKITTIHQGNALRVKWADICPADKDTEIFVCGNPPYLGHFGRSAEQNTDMTIACSAVMENYKDIDYVGCWLVKLTQYIERYPLVTGAFVTTTSICQGEQVPLLWKYIFSRGVTIRFAYTAFQWSNNASHNAAVTCIVVGLASSTATPKRLYTDDHYISVENINAYLVPSASNQIVTKEKLPLSDLPPVVKGNKTLDGGHLMLTPKDKVQLLSAYPGAAPLVRRFYNVDGLLSNVEQYILWITDSDLELAESLPPIAKRLRETARYRLHSGIDAKRIASTPHRFGSTTYRPEPALAIPQVSTERRAYLPIGLLGPTELASQQLFLIYNPEPWIFSVLSSRLHIMWAFTIGRIVLKTLRYSATLVYNTFPLPELSAEQKRILADNAKLILKARAKFPAKTLSWLYEPDTMPPELFQAHQENDAYIEELVYGRKFKDDTKRLQQLFAKYSNIKDAAERENSLFETVASKKAV